jgi:hypothetical protein
LVNPLFPDSPREPWEDVGHGAAGDHLEAGEPAKGQTDGQVVGHTVDLTGKLCKKITKYMSQYCVQIWQVAAQSVAQAAHSAVDSTWIPQTKHSKSYILTDLQTLYWVPCDFKNMSSCEDYVRKSTKNRIFSSLYQF